MRSITIPLSLFIAIVGAAFGFVEPMPLGEQAHQADAILRVVVVSYDSLKLNEGEESFQALAKCRVIEDFRGDYRLGQFIYIPCAYNYDEDPSPIDAEGDYVVFLDTLEVAPIGHPLAFNAVYPINQGKITDPENDDKEVPLSAFVERISKLLKNKAEQAGKVQPASGKEGGKACDSHHHPLKRVTGFLPDPAVTVSPEYGGTEFRVQFGHLYPHVRPWTFSPARKENWNLEVSVEVCGECETAYEQAFAAYLKIDEKIRRDQYLEFLKNHPSPAPQDDGAKKDATPAGTLDHLPSDIPPP